MLFWPFILNDIVTPISQVVWLLLRLFVLSIDQKYYWGAIIFIVFFFIYRLFSPIRPIVRSEGFQNSDANMRAIDHWHSLFTMTAHDVLDKKSLKRELVGLLLSLYATKQRTSADFRLYEALQRGEISIPEHIHNFLFLEEPQKAGWSFKKLIQSIQNAPRKWIHRWTGQEIAEHYRMIDEVLSFLEASLEMKNDDGKFNRN
jgi:hypothetical protein